MRFQNTFAKMATASAQYVYATLYTCVAGDREREREIVVSFFLPLLTVCSYLHFSLSFSLSLSVSLSLSHLFCLCRTAVRAAQNHFNRVLAFG